MKTNRPLGTWAFTFQMIKAAPLLFIGNAGVWGVLYHVGIAPALIGKALFDYLSSNASIGSPLDHRIWAWIVLIVALRFVRALGTFPAAWVFAAHRYVLGRMMRMTLLARVFMRGGAMTSTLGSGEDVNRFRDDVDTPVLLVSDATVDQTGILIRTAVVLTIMIRIDPFVTAASVLPLILLTTGVNLVRRRMELYWSAGRDSAGAVAGMIADAFGNILAVKTASAEDRLAATLDALGETRRKAELKRTLFKELIDTILGNTEELGTALVLIASAGAMARGSFTIGDFALFAAFLPTMSHSLYGWIEMTFSHRHTKVSLQRLAEIVPEQKIDTWVYAEESRAAEGAAGGPATPPAYAYPPKTTPSTPTPSLHSFRTLQAIDLGYRYPRTERGVAGVGLSITRGSFVVVTGRVGSGKTTLIRLLLGLLPIQNGELRLNGETLPDPSTAMVPPLSAYVPQVPKLFDGTVRDNILLGHPAEADEVAEAIHLAVLERDIEALDHGLDTLVGSKGRRLSGGQVQRIAAARAFVRQTDLVVLDDLSSALDAETEALLWERLPKLRHPAAADAADAGSASGASGADVQRSPTILAVSHRRAALRAADRIILLADGFIADEGTLGELLDRSAEMRALWDAEGRGAS